MLKKIRSLLKRVIRIFSKAPKGGPMDEYDGVRCKVYLIDGVRLVGTVRLQEDPHWIKVEGNPKSCLLRVTQIASITVA